jgi:hypothetical protein
LSAAIAKYELKGALKSLKAPINIRIPRKPLMSCDKQRSKGLQAAVQIYQRTPILPDSNSETQYIRPKAGRDHSTETSEAL